MSRSIPNPLSFYNIVDDTNSSTTEINMLSTPENSSTVEFKKEIEQEVDEVTSILLSERFTFSMDPDVYIENTPIWRSKLENVVHNRMWLNYPYILTTSDDPNSVDHLELHSPQEVYELYEEFFVFETEELSRGSSIKEQISLMTDGDLEEFSDSRIIGMEEF